VIDKNSLNRLGSGAMPQTDPLIQKWLSRQCAMVGVVFRAVVIVAENQNLAACWPGSALPSDDLAELGVRACTEQRALTEHGGENVERVALLVKDGDLLLSVLVVEVSQQSVTERRALVNLLHWGCEWLKFALAQRRDYPPDLYAPVLEVMSGCIEHDELDAAASSLVNVLARRLSCDGVALGMLDNDQLNIRALSLQANFSQRSAHISAIRAAMKESLDQDCAIHYPGSEELPTVMDQAHVHLARVGGAETIYSLPLVFEGEHLGVLLFEKASGESFASEQLVWIQQVAIAAASLLALKQRDEKNIIAIAWFRLRRFFRQLLGPDHIKKKLAVFVGGFLLLLFSLVSIDYRVTADAVIEGAVQRVVASPVDGFVAEANFRAGDIIKAQQTIGRLDDKDLKLEHTRLISERLQYHREYRDALASKDRAQAQIVKSQMDQADAQISLLDKKLKRTHIKAPFDALIIEGDLHQSLGAPVSLGEVLFVLAPLNAYRVIINVDERDIDEVYIGQTGHLKLASNPKLKHPVVVEKITAVSTAGDERNVFRVEASVQVMADERVLPGMEGVASVDIESRKLIWVWTHRIVDWLQLLAWKWLP
jgi:hypothetical protein